MKPTMDQVKDIFIRAERLRMTALCLDIEIDHINNMINMYRKADLMDKKNSWVNGFWPFVELMKIKGCSRREDLYDIAIAQLEEIADSCETKNQRLNKLLQEAESNDYSSETYPTEH